MPKDSTRQIVCKLISSFSKVILNFEKLVQGVTNQIAKNSYFCVKLELTRLHHFILCYRGYQTRVYHAVIGRDTLECNIWFWVEPHQTATILYDFICEVLQSNVVQPMSKWYTQYFTFSNIWFRFWEKSFKPYNLHGINSRTNGR